MITPNPTTPPPHMRNPHLLTRPLISRIHPLTLPRAITRFVDLVVRYVARALPHPRVHVVHLEAAALPVELELERWFAAAVGAAPDHHAAGEVGGGAREDGGVGGDGVGGCGAEEGEGEGEGSGVHTCGVRLGGGSVEGRRTDLCGCDAR